MKGRNEFAVARMVKITNKTSWKFIYLFIYSVALWMKSRPSRMQGQCSSSEIHGPGMAHGFSKWLSHAVLI